MKLAAERERAQREEAQRLLAEQQRTKVASVDRKQPTSPSLAGLSSDIRNVPPTQAAPANQAAPATQAAPVSADPCERDGAMLAQLRSNPSLEAVIQFERSLTCEKLRAQALRLQESLSSVANAAQAIAVPVVPAKPAMVAPPPAVAIAPPPLPPKQEAAPKPPADPPKVAIATAEPTPGCKQDEARLAKIRANPSLAELAALERDLGCERLRPQIVRLRESLPKTELSNVEPKVDQPAAANAATPIATPPAQAPERPAEVKQAQQAPAPAGPVAQVRSCDEERAILAKLRASQSREDVVKFERELACEQLRPQVIRLKESLSGG